MTKYSEEVKLAAVQDYGLGNAGIAAIAQRHGVNRHALRRWVATYQIHGVAGLRAKRVRYGTSFKQEVVRQMRQDGLSYRQTAARFDIRNFNIIARWERQYDVQGLVASSTGEPVQMDSPEKPVSPDAMRTREDLLKELQFLRMENAYLKKLDALVQAKQKAAQQKKRK